MALPSRKTRPRSIHQNAGTSPPIQENFTRHWLNSTHKRQTPQLRGTTTFQPEEKRLQTQQIKQNENTEKYAADKGTWLKKTQMIKQMKKK